ncbi:MAG: hypothetical protein J7559_12610 [Cohnella sp.]|nr:hypothetical protein [Cohnella sp.]
MGRRIEKQPDGKYAVWSTIVDDYIIVDATPEQIIESFIEDARTDIETSVRRDIDRLNRG